MRKTVYIGAICILGLLITTAVLPAVGTMNVCKTSVMGEVKDQHQEKSILSSKLVTLLGLFLQIQVKLMDQHSID